MKKFTLVLSAFILMINVGSAKHVEADLAKQVAQNFILQNARYGSLDLTLAVTERSAAGEADYYVFDVNNHSGFVVICAEDAARPVIGYSTEGPFIQPSASVNPNFNFWMEKRKTEIEYIRANKMEADQTIKNEWTNYSSTLKTGYPVVNVPVTPLCAANWGQGGTYNDLCPGGSVTGCVATAMAIIMKKWAYPTTGTGSSSYNSGSYGTLTANYGTTTYNWSAMTTPYCSGTNTSVATIMYHCGVSVEMSYSPSGSGAMVCGQPGAEYSFKTYFGYDPGILCVMQASDPNWVADLKTEFNAGRPVQYQGVDASQGGHTWVCDGYDATDKMHMNWGWDGSSNGYFDVNNLSVSGLNFTTQLGGLTHIKPKILAALDAGISLVTNPNGTTCSTTFTPIVTLKNFGTATLTSCTINYKVDNNTVQTFSWTGSLASNASVNVTLTSMTVTAGSHTFTSYTSNPNGSTDGNTTNDQTQNTFNVATNAASLPLQEGFESSTNIPAGWTLYNPDADAAWQVSTTVHYSTGSHSIGFNNCDGDGSTDMTGRKDRLITTTYNFSNATSAQMAFDVAYSPLYYQSTMYGDTLAVYASTNCGTTWTRIYYKGGVTLGTCAQQTAITACWVPTANDWRNDVTNLSSLCGQASVMFAFEDVSMWGEWIYLDNINITSVTGSGIFEYNSSLNFSLYPNPTTGQFTVSGLQSAGSQIEIFNLMGEKVYQTTANTKQETISLDAPKGMYFIKVTDGDSSFTKKLNKQ
jgi:hypothetical protein